MSRAVRISHRAVADHRRRLDLFDDGRARGARQQKQQPRVTKSGLVLREKHAAGLVFGVGVGDVEAHATGARRAHFQVDPGLVLGGRAVQEAHVANQLGHRLGQQERLEVLGAGVVKAHPIVLEPRAHLCAAVEDILVGQPRRRVHTVHNHFGTVLANELDQVVVAICVVELVVQCRQQQPPGRHVAEQVFAPHTGKLSRHKQVAPGRDKGDPVAVLIFEDGAGFFRLSLIQRRHHDPPRVELLDDVTADLKPDQTGSSEDQEVVVHNGSPEQNKKRQVGTGAEARGPQTVTCRRLTAGR